MTAPISEDLRNITDDLALHLEGCNAARRPELATHRYRAWEVLLFASPNYCLEPEIVRRVTAVVQQSSDQGCEGTTHAVVIRYSVCG